MSPDLAIIVSIIALFGIRLRKISISRAQSDLAV